MEKEISMEKLAQMEKDFRGERANLLAMNAVCASGPKTAAKNQDDFRTDLHQFSVNLEQGDITNQKRSGRCWMFAALNTMRFQVMKKLNLKTFELSQNYLLFYDKLEKSNYFLENILQTLDEPASGRLIDFLLTSPIGDGGQWDMICALIDKYGVVPKQCMPETFSSSNTTEMVSTITEKLREDAFRLRKAYEGGHSVDELRAMKDQMMATIYRMLSICLGVPPKTVDLEVRDKDEKFIRDTNLTPKAFYEKYVGLDLGDYISLINAPTQDKPYYHSYTVRFLGNVVEGRKVRYVNLPVEELKKAAIAQMQDGQPVWFGCDVGQRSERTEGLMALTIYDYDDLFQTDFAMDKAARLDYKESLMTHAMVFQGVNLDEKGRPNRWRVENSWGKDIGRDGYFVMTDDWFSEYVYQVVVNKKYVSEDALKAYESEPIVLEPWDPMGSLAICRG